MGIYATIKDACKGKGISLKDLSDKTGIPARTMWRWDTNAPAIDKVAAVAEALGVSIDYLFGAESQTEPDNFALSLLGKVQSPPPDRSVGFSLSPAEREIVALLRDNEEFRGMVERIASTYKSAVPEK